MIEHSLYGPLPREVWQRLAAIRLLICDVDGVLSDGMIYLGNQGEEYKSFCTKDGFGIKALLNAGIQVAVITGRDSRIVSERMASLGVRHVYQGQGDKMPSYRALLDTLKLEPSQAAYIGDDVVDLAVMRHCGLGVAVADAHPLVLRGADYVTRLHGGRGAVRELCDLILEARGELEQARGMSL
ncbi:3-deoxy-manno-octulosonate-8-phosphatase KdsC [Zobellella taiwanensis]|jgi:3-deoxy-D-manno-octulosonate 8-phosphate phosphatase (KDO 8-P phosphatase)|uniref:3-deoxy-D-manno-octulosonate 8-phosphate phosphatase KdsC n=1 Tax=Zobellella taiwanensis TaxID=347535 RepID=A0A2P7QQC8_9GAMM|nr:3-deoxy-manno-octulosonate-8-phosphatase KdsC [Zobellella taiwanensis]PSJ40144.1 3-deoxy-manno-octulosonate-8-phosphatase KdsC [Zobellella taiwanensis]